MGNQINRSLALVSCSIFALAANATEMPQDIQEAFAANRHAIESDGAARVARDHRNQYHVDFREGGVTVSPVATDTGRSSSWMLGLRLAGYGTPDHIQPVADAKIEMSGARLEYRRGAITEWYENKPAGLEQGFTLHEAPSSGATDVVLALAVEGGLLGKWERPGEYVAFVAESGDPKLFYGELRVTDADGKPVPARLALGPDRLEIHVQAGTAKWPIVVDPLIAEPGEPVINWIEADYVLDDAKGTVEIPVRWSHFYGEPALTAQYWLDDELVLTRAVVDEDDQSGSATLVIDEGGEHEVTVALCNTEGCSASDPLIFRVIDPVRGVGSVADASVGENILSYKEAAQIVQETAARLGTDRESGPTIRLAAEQTWGTWLVSLVGQAALKYGLSMGFDALVTKLGLGQSGPDLAAELEGIDQSLGEIKDQLDKIANKIDVGKADTDFKNSHRLADLALGNINSIAGNIAEVEAGVSPSTQTQLESWAKDNRDNIAALRSLLVNSLTGAVPLLLDYYQLKYPVSTGIEVRDEIEGYLNSFRAALGVGLMSQAWLTKAFEPNALYDKGAERDAQATVVTAYGLTGAPYPQPPSGAPGFIHRIGTDWGLVDAARPTLSGESARAVTQNRNEVWLLFSGIATGAKAPGDLTIRDYMEYNDVKRTFHDPNSVRIDHRDSFFECETWVRHDELYVGPDRAHTTTHTTYNKKYVCSFGSAKPNRESKAQEAYLKQTFSANEKIYSVDVPMNAWGMPALMDERSIEGYRDGIDVKAITREEGNAVTLAYDTGDYDWIQLRDPAADDDVVFFTGANQGRTLNLTTTSDAVEIVQGYRIENRTGDDSLLPRERTIVTANPGATSINLTLDPS